VCCHSIIINNIIIISLTTSVLGGLFRRRPDAAAAAACMRLFSSEMTGHLSSERVERIVNASARRIVSLYHDFGSSDYIGEPMSIHEHSVQTANKAKQAGESEEAQLACLFHDVGHILGLEAGNPPGMDGCGTEDHELVGANFLGHLGFSNTVAYLTLHHVNAKRYLVTRVPNYELTEASRITLAFQGGPMTEDECVKAEADDRWPIVLRMRSYDEGGKDPSVPESTIGCHLPTIANNIRSTLSSLVHGVQANYPLSPFSETYVLSSEQVNRWDQFKYVVLRGTLPVPDHCQPTISATSLGQPSEREVVRDVVQQCFPGRNIQLDAIHPNDVQVMWNLGSESDLEGSVFAVVVGEQNGAIGGIDDEDSLSEGELWGPNDREVVALASPSSGTEAKLLAKTGDIVLVRSDLRIRCISDNLSVWRADAE
jgi:predicted HD phosphohydrolase